MSEGDVVLGLVLGISVLSFVFAGFLAYSVLRKDCGTKEMQKVSDAIREGANAFIVRQYTTIAVFSVVLGVLIFCVYAFFGKFDFGLRTSVAFLFGAFCSGLAGVIGLWISVRTNVRVASASRRSLDEALKIAFRGGAVSGVLIVAMSLAGVGVLYWVYSVSLPVAEVPFLVVGFGFGASFVALFAQLGGGIYTKGADVGADLVGKVEKGIPEDDPRNPAVIADLVGDNVGDCAGRGADLFESTAAENIGAMILGVALYPFFGVSGVLFPLVARASGLIASMIGILCVYNKKGEDPMTSLNRGYYITAFLAALFFAAATYWMLGDYWFWFFMAGLVGIITSVLIVWITVYYTEQSYRPVKSIAKASQTGSATNIMIGFAVALETTALPVVVLAAALLLTYNFGVRSGVPGGGLYGTAIATMGMLSTCAFVLAMDTFGPITDNAGGIVQMSGQSESYRRITDRLDAVGNTTKALTKGYAIGSAALASFLLFSAYLDEVAKYAGSVPVVDLSHVPVFVGGMLGAMLVFLFTSFAIRAVGQTAFEVVNEVRRQFKEIKGLSEGRSRPDYARCVDICARTSLKEMVLPGVFVVGLTVAVGVLLHAEAMGAYLMVSTITGILMALMLNTGGGAWDNAKKYIEEGSFGGKGSEAHKAAVIGDTLGDPFKDTAGPSLHVLIKLLSTLTLVLAPLFV
ncbi:K(+)-stimulated pyrophosphate-energized sodium pump [uncultured archaeon]|nr:K(+)-stimulated pyrophosphate-energized sodium pump [uncultured archaeon]